MKRWLSLVLALSLALVLAACGSASSTDKSQGSNKEVTLTVGASNVPHAEILKQAQPILKEKGINLKIVTFQDYILPNKALATNQIDANYFQTIPYFNLQMKENGYKFSNAGGIHIEPIGVYSKKYKSLKDLPNGAHIIISNSVSDHPRLLLMLQKLGLIELKPGIDPQQYDIKDIVSNPKNLKLDANYEAALLPKIYKNGEGDAVLINSNYAIDNGLDPMKDSIAHEPSDPKSPYVNIIAVRKGDENKPAIKTLVQVLHSKQIQDWIKQKYHGAVLPVSE
ncbi:MetQ/NlpA family ABC transporter substrate-binding protein [Neobacillus ginsengisoli]|uniref:Lipoprotein n=1 Tax=Neobacillus ginsengisoli TaxID=904295 RepID=A0ABT9XU20_9BACI|nr:MetQ/NlpA family ABC transporter substrate-binding protein [Neobacillus ginsengisoli]MDQ0198883.1 D-methionine transport system substrate-binding protein [Neobacillus ginsengisoli]